MKGWWQKRGSATQHAIAELPLLKGTIDATGAVPHVIYQTWETRDIPERMRAAIAAVVEANPGFTHRFFDAAERRDFLAEHFTDEVVTAYDTLAPGAFKADLWRYCILYLRGGYYLDVKFEPVNGWSLASLTEPTYVLDNYQSFNHVSHGIYNAFLMAKPGCPVMKAAITIILRNVQSRFVGEGPLDITGPSIFGKLVARDACILYWDLSRIVTLDCHRPLLRMYDGYREDCASAGIIHYSKMWPDSIYVG